jgi:methionyl-tRNA formyltransferase
MKVIFMGTPDFAVPALQDLINSDHEIVGVFTKPPKPAGRGYQEIKSKVHILAEESGLPVFTPSTFKEVKNVEQFKKLNADVAVVAAYGLILRKEILDAPKYGCINIHPSRLPRWRGAAPIQHTILSGDKETSVCVMQMDEGMDTGDILLQKDLEVPTEMTAKDLHDKTAIIGGEMITQVLDQINNGSANPVAQSTEGVLYAAKITRDSERINWHKNAEEIFNQIRTFSPRPGAFFRYEAENIKIITADFAMVKHSGKQGEVLDNKLSIACKEGVLKPKLLQREGKKMIYTDAFLRGFPIPIGAILS